MIITAIVVSMCRNPVLLASWWHWKDADVFFWLIGALSIPMFIALLVRDDVLRKSLVKAIRIQVDQARCPGCRYILIGLKAIEDIVICPECGRSTFLPSLGLHDRDLIPPESDFEYIERDNESQSTQHA